MAQLGGFTVNHERETLWRVFARWLVIAFGVVLAAHTSPGISYTGKDSLGSHGLVTLALVVIVLSFFNIVLKPLLIFFTLPFVVFSLGLGLLFINAVLFLLAGKLVPGFHVDGFWSAFWGALVVSVVSFLANRWLGRRRFVPSTRGLGGQRPQSPAARRDDDVIDV